MSAKTSAKAKPDSLSWTDAGIQGGSFLLTMVQTAAQCAPVPYLQQAAGAALVIVNTIATTRNNKEDFERLARDAVTLVAVIWRAYEVSNNKKEWPPRALRDVILEFCSTLDSIVKFAQDRGTRKWIFRAVYNSFDLQKIAEYRETLTSAVQTFQVASDLNVNEMLYEVLEKQNKMIDRMEHNTNLLEGHMSGKISRPSRKEERVEERIYYDEHRYSPARWDDTPSGSSNGYNARLPHTPMSFTNIQNSGISFGDGGVSVSNGFS